MTAVVHVVTSLERGGAQRVVLEIAAHLHDAGRPQLVVTGARTAAAGSLDDEAERRLGKRLLRLPELVGPVDAVRDALAAMVATSGSPFMIAMASAPAAPIAPAVVASPSLTSTMLKAFMQVTSHSTLTSSSTGEGTAVISMATPAFTSTKAATSWPTSLSRGVRAPRSSMRPTETTMLADSRMASTRGSKGKVTANASRNATKMTRPPR